MKLRPLPDAIQTENRFLRSDGQAVLAEKFPGLSDYVQTLEMMEARSTKIADGLQKETLWLLEHPPLYTAGTSANPKDLLWPNRFPVHDTGRGGEYTYHGPGQLVGYAMLDLKARQQDVRAYVYALEQWLIDALASFGIKGERRADRVGVWVVRTDKQALPSGGFPEDKIAAIGIRLRRWVSFHGVALNINPDLSHFGGIVPCGVAEHGVTSLYDLGVDAGRDEVEKAMLQAFETNFGPVSNRSFATQTRR